MPHRIDLQARRNQHYLYSGRSVLVVNCDGWCSGAGTEGFFYKNTRFVSRFKVLIDGRPPRPSAVSPVAADSLLAYYESEETDLVPVRSLYLEHRAAVADGWRSELVLTNFTRDTPIDVPLEIVIDADFADSDEAETGRRLQHGNVQRSWRDNRLCLRYCHEALDHALEVSFEGPGVRFEDGSVRAQISLPPRRSSSFALMFTPIFDGRPEAAPPRVFPSAAGGLASVREQLRTAAPVLETSNHTVQGAWDTALADLMSLPLGLEDAPAMPMAGLPLYQQFFGRDALTMSWQGLMAGSGMLRDSLIACASWQGTRVDDFYDEQPGKMIHQARWGPLSALKLDPFSRYYGDWATPLDFLVGLGQYYVWTADRDTVRMLLPAARKVLRWAASFGDLDRDGFLEYRRRSPVGVEHQGWKDSDDAIVDSAGKPYPAPVAACEIQGYFYAGLQQAAQAFLACGHPAEAASLLARASALRRRFERAFWMPREQFYAMALTEGGAKADAIASNAGHLLACGIVSRGRARLVARRLLQPDMFSGWGVRTLSSDNAFYNPFSYHRGSVWPVEQGTIAFGLARYGLWDELHTLARAVFDLTDLFFANRLPEVVAGNPRDELHPHPGLYPYSCQPQGWSASAIILLVQSLLGLRPIAPLNLLVLDPHLPEWLPDLRLSGLKVGSSALDLRFERNAAGRTAYHVERSAGPVRVIRQTVPNAGPALHRRALDLASSIRAYL